MAVCTSITGRMEKSIANIQSISRIYAVNSVGTVLDSTFVMKISIPEWQGWISPVFDVAAHLLVVSIKDGEIQERHKVPLTADGLMSRVQQVTALGVDVLICGAISWPLELALSKAGIEVVAQTCGEVEHVLSSFIDGRFSQEAFLMPGCWGRRRRFRGQYRCGRASPDSADPLR